MGMVIGVLLTLILYSSAYSLVPQFDDGMQLTDRITLGFKCLLFPGFFLLAMVIKVGSQRFGNSAEDPTEVIAGTESMKIDLRVLSNTNEQLLIFAINTLGLAVLLPLQYLSLLPIYSGLFVVGRIIFLLGYHHNVLWRGPGFVMAIFPAVVGIVYCCSRVLFGLFSGNS